MQLLHQPPPKLPTTNKL